MQPPGGKDMALDQSVQRTQRRGASADLIGERRQAEVDPFTGVALALPAERLMLAELLEQDHRQQARTGKAARRDMERRRRLGDRLAPPAGEPLPNGLDHLPLTGDNLERLRDVLAELRQLRRTAAGAAQRRPPITGLASRGDRCSGNALRRARLRSKVLTMVDDEERSTSEFVLRRVRLGVFQLHLQLVEKPLLARSSSRLLERAPKLFDLQLQSRNQRLSARRRRARMRQIGLRVRRSRFALKPRQHVSARIIALRFSKVGIEEINRPCHLQKGIISAAGL